MAPNDEEAIDQLTEVLTEGLSEETQELCNSMLHWLSMERSFKRVLASQRAEMNELRASISEAIQEKHLLQEQVAALIRQVELLEAGWSGDVCTVRGYPAVPTEKIVPKKKLIPKTSGVYFFWERTKVAYVGQTADLQQRIAGTTHEHLRDGDLLSWLEFPLVQLIWAESFYIGVCQPYRNGRKPRKHGATRKLILEHV